jgi:hypothetical protein
MLRLHGVIRSPAAYRRSVRWGTGTGGPPGGGGFKTHRGAVHLASAGHTKRWPAPPSGRRGRATATCRIVCRLPRRITVHLLGLRGELITYSDPCMRSLRVGVRAGVLSEESGSAAAAADCGLIVATTPAGVCAYPRSRPARRGCPQCFERNLPPKTARFQ